MNEKEKNQIISAIFVLCLFIVTTIISIILLYNQFLQLKKQKPLFNLSCAIDINLINNIVIIILTTFFLYNNYNSRSKYYKKERILASIFDVISASVVLYIAIDVYLNKDKFI